MNKVWEDNTLAMVMIADVLLYMVSDCNIDRGHRHLYSPLKFTLCSSATILRCVPRISMNNQSFLQDKEYLRKLRPPETIYGMGIVAFRDHV